MLPDNSGMFIPSQGLILLAPIRALLTSTLHAACCMAQKGAIRAQYPLSQAQNLLNHLR